VRNVSICVTRSSRKALSFSPSRWREAANQSLLQQA
jgi:hypothetical protein